MASDHRDHWQAVAERLNALLATLSDLLSPDERTEVADFIDASEYGLALETLVSIIDEENKTIAKATANEIVALAESMRLAVGPLQIALAKHIE